MSTYIAPLGWNNSPRQLAQAIPMSPLIPMIPGGQQIFFVEDESDLSLRNARLSNHIGSASQMTFYTNQSALENTTTLEILTKGICGGYSALAGKKLTPYQHPYFPGMYAKDFIDCVPFEPEAATPAQVWANYNLCKLTISFESLPYPVNAISSPGNDYNQNWIEWRHVSSSNRISCPLGLYRFSTGPFTGFPATFGSWITAPYTQFSATIYACTQQQVFGGVLTQQPVFAQYCGQVNALPFAGWNAQSILFDNSEVQPYQDWLGNQLFNVRLNFIGQPQGWNAQPDLAGNFNDIVFIEGGGLPFKTTDFKANLFTPLNPF